MTRSAAGLCGLCMLVALVSTSLTLAEEPMAPRVDALAQPYIDHDVIQGMTIGVIHRDQRFVRGYGSLSAERAGQLDQDTVYEIGSISKVFTGLLLADAVIRNEASLAQPAQELAPEGWTILPREHPITLLSLATHTSGLPRLPDNMPSADPDNPYADYTPELLREFLQRYQPSQAAGKAIEYSNLGMGLLGLLLANRQGSTYEQLLKDRITTPLGMTSTVVELSPALRSRLAPPHNADGAVVANWDLPTLVGAGGIRSTVRDMLAFADAHLAPPPGELGKAIELCWQVHQQPIAASDFPICLGWHVAQDQQTRWHNGQTGGYHAMLLVNRNLPAAVVVLANTATDQVDVLAQDVMRTLAGAPITPKTFETTVEVSPEAMQRLVGKYAIVPQFVLTVSVDDGKLMVGATGQPTFRVFPRSETEWFYKVVDATLTFKVDNEGNCRELDLFQNGIHQTARRLDE